MRHFILLSSLAIACVGDDNGLPDAGKDAGNDTTQQNDVVTQDVTQDVATEAGPFNANVYPNLELWLSADVGTGDAGSVSTWQDRSAKNRVVHVPTSDVDCTMPPVLVQSAQNGLPMAKFDGVFNCMTVSGAFQDFTAGFTAFVVMEPGNCNSSFTGGSGAVFDSFNPASTYSHGIMIGRDKTIANTASGDALLLSAAEVGGEEVQIIGGGSWVPSTPHLIEFRLPAAPSSQAVAGLAYVDGTLASLGTNGPVSPDFDGARTSTYIGDRKAPNASSYHMYCGMLGEMLIYSKALADADRQTIESHLKTRWGL